MTQLPAHVARLITQPTVPAWVAQREAKRFQLAWQATAVSCRIYELPEPTLNSDGILLAAVQGENQVWVEGTAVRPYFALEFQGGPYDGQRLIVAERILPLEGVPNFRDIGGYETANGRFTRWGLIYRSGDLHEAKTADLDTLATLGLQNICDLRTAGEITSRPDQLPTPHPTWTDLAINSRSPRWRQLIDVIRYRKRLQQLLVNGYINIFLEENAAKVGFFLSQLADPANLPVLIHCTAGKDRTGLSIALLLSILGVPEVTILADYSLSNYEHATFYRIMQADVARLIRFGFKPESLETFFVANPVVLKTALDHVKNTYGSIETYLLQRANMRQDTLQRIRNNLLI
ncbi:MAG: tyrosine-protein phosphatase [Chloroflexota bacterium]